MLVCGSLEPGKDGVGDYSRLLSAELIQLGHDLRIIATNDKAATEVIREEQWQENTAVPVLRIPYGVTNRTRIAILQEEIDNFLPEWVSLQYVPYSFNRYGVPVDFALALRRIRFTGEWHIMFHELWIDQRGIWTPKDTTISYLQRLAVVLLQWVLGPSVKHTHLPAYQTKMLPLGVTTLALPLFANIRPVKTSVTSPPSKVFRLGFFSQMNLKPEIIRFIKELANWLQGTENQELEILLLGGGADKVNLMKKGLLSSIPMATIKPLGFLPSEELSQHISTLNLGITPVRHHAIGKSGTVAAFLSHGVPVAAPWLTQSCPSFFDETLSEAVITNFTPKGLKAAMEAAQTLDTTVISPRGIAQRMLGDLSLSVAASTATSKRVDQPASH